MPVLLRQPFQAECIKFKVCRQSALKRRNETGNGRHKSQ